MSNYFNGNGTIGFTCDVCGRELNGCSIVNGMKFCTKCYQETFGKDNQQNEIQQLKQQLEESFTEKDVEGLIEDRNKTIKFLQKELAEKQNTIDEINREFVQAVHDWKTLCAEKDKEIERLKDFIGCKGCVDVIKKSNENQTQLAIQELEGVEQNKKYEYIAIPNEKILLVEDGSVDVDYIEEDLGIKCIVYRQGANKPEWLEK